jgi:CubicO group peptidase (beta-lactamase class C family)
MLAYSMPMPMPSLRARGGRNLLSIAAACALAPLLWAAALLPATAHGQASGATPDAATPMTGEAVPELASYDRIIPALMRRWHVPGGAVAVVKDGRMILARGYGWADQESRQPVQPESLFRIASLTKPITAAAVLELVEGGRLRLDAPAFALLGDLARGGGVGGEAGMGGVAGVGHVAGAAGVRSDPRLRQVTILNLLQHTGGWDPDQSFDPMFRSRDIARAEGVPAPAGAAAIVRYMLDKPLQAAPGTRYAYSNFGYCVLGRVIEKATGRRYEDYVQANVLRPAGITRMRLGHTLPGERAPGEVRYYGYPGIGLARSVFPGVPPRVPWPYGGWYIEAMDSHGGWIASAVDLARFVCAVDGRGHRPQILRPRTIERMTARPAPPVAVGADSWYGMGWQVRPAGGDANWWHNGSLDGTSTIMVRANNGLTWVALFNSRPKNADRFGSELDGALWRAAGAVERWPAHDRFKQFAGR